MNRLLAWIAAARWRQSLSHCFEGLFIQVPIALAVQSWWTASLCTVVWYYSRKKLEVELASAYGSRHVYVWSAGWLPWDWSSYQVLDVVLPTLSSCLIAWAMHGWPFPLAFI